MTKNKDTRAEFEAILRYREMLPEGSVMTDAVLIAAVENFGDYTQYSYVYPDGDGQATHRTLGLVGVLQAALAEDGTHD